MMRTLVCGACALIAIGLMAVSATLSYRFSYGLGGTPLEAHGYALAAAGVDILKGFLPFVIFLRLREGRRLAATAGLLVFIIGVIWSFTSALGLAAQVRMDRANTNDNRLASYREIKSLLGRIEGEQAKILRKRSAAEISGDIDGKLAAAVVVTAKVTRTVGGVSEQCARPTRSTSGVCVTVWQLRQELAAAREWERLEAEAHAARGRVDALRQAGAGDLATADAQADFLARAIGLITGREIDQNWMRLAVVVLLGILLEVGSSCGLYTALGSHSLRHGPTATPQHAVNAIEATGDAHAYCDARLVHRTGSRLSMRAIHQDYEAWCRAHGVDALERKCFMRGLRQERQGRRWSIAGGVVHHVAFTSISAT